MLCFLIKKEKRYALFCFAHAPLTWWNLNQKKDKFIKKKTDQALDAENKSKRKTEAKSNWQSLINEKIDRN